MKHSLSLFFLLFILTYFTPGHAEPDVAPERIFWDKTPIQITLPVGSERMVTFPDNVRLGLPATVSAKLRTQSNQGTVYWLAHEPFDATRIQVQGIDSGQVYLLDVRAVKDQSPLNPIEIQLKKPLVIQAQPTGTLRNTRSDYVLLTRFAAQQLYAPARLLKTPRDIYRRGVKQLPITHLIRGQTIEATPIAAWRKDRLFVTAIQLKNASDQPVVLDPRTIRGEWLAATFQHARLHASGTELDTTALYLISHRPFAEVL